MRVIKGIHKGRVIYCADSVRPVSSRVRESCFDILAYSLKGANVLDLFAGSGALGIEALSSGANKCIFIDSNRKSIKIIEKNLEILGLSTNSVYLKDSFASIEFLSKRRDKFDLIFLDPPYHEGSLKKVLQMLSEYDILSPFGLLVGFCFEKDDYLKNSEKFALIQKKKYGQTLLLIYKKQ
ncbi:MAG: 16S rRNA (guanine(966)-N(2))-methyltransferase RsmD [Candidatus Omnitrophica bacterium]|nr:16S rRNA (guanine(966)-N(2))-methyltransferase RsmD [Candidatus Omnitrophota bacterium]